MAWFSSRSKCDDCPARAQEDCVVSDVVRLSNFSPGQKGTIHQVCGDPAFRLRMMEMGFVRGAEVAVVKYAPLSDPVEYIIKGYHLILRRDQAQEILMNAPGKVA